MTDNIKLEIDNRSEEVKELGKIMASCNFKLFKEKVFKNTNLIFEYRDKKREANILASMTATKSEEFQILATHLILKLIGSKQFFKLLEQEDKFKKKAKSFIFKIPHINDMINSLKLKHSLNIHKHGLNLRQYLQKIKQNEIKSREETSQQQNDIITIHNNIDEAINKFDQLQVNFIDMPR